MVKVGIFGFPVFTISQQVLSPYHAMGCNPVSMVDPLGLQFFGPQTPMTVQDPAALARFMAPTLLKHMPGGGLWDLSNMNRYITQLPKELRAEAWMMYLSGGAIGGSTFQSKLADVLQERAARGNDRKGSWASMMFTEFVYQIEDGYEISFDQDVLNTTVVHRVNFKKEFFDRWEKWLRRGGTLGLAMPLPFPGLFPYPGTTPELPSWEGTQNWFKHNTPNLHPIHLIQELTRGVMGVVDGVLDRVFSKDGKQNKWPTHYGDPPTAKNTDWGKSDGQLADEAANRIGDSKRGPGAAHNEAKKVYRNKRPR